MMTKDKQLFGSYVPVSQCATSTFPV